MIGTFVRHQEDHLYINFNICFSCVYASSLAGRRTCSTLEYILPPARHCIALNGMASVKSPCNLLYPPLDMDNKTKKQIIKTTSVVSVCLRSQRSWTKCSNKMCLVWLMFRCCFKTSRFENNVTIKFGLACKQWQYNVFSK
jgi:hypothetical protein